MSTAKHKFVGPHPADLADGRVGIPGEFYDIKVPAADIDQMLLDEGALVAAPPDAPAEKPKAIPAAK